MNKKYLIGGGVLFLLLLVLIYYSKSDEVKDETPAPAPPAPAPNATTTQALDPNQGDGKFAVESYAKSIFKDSKLMEQIKRNNGIGGNLFGDVVPSKVKILLSNKVLGKLNLSDSYGLPIIPSIIDGGTFQKKVEDFAVYTKYPRPKIDSLGWEEAAKETLRKGTFANAGFSIVPSDAHDAIVRNDKGYSDCDQIRKSKREECIRDNWEDFGKQLHKVANNISAENKKLDKFLFDYAAQKLVNNGWKLIGYFPSNV